jgi:hypothetical protein
MLKRVDSGTIIKDVSCQQILYCNSVQMEDYPQSPVSLRMGDYLNFSLYSESNEVDDSFTSFKFFSK